MHALRIYTRKIIATMWALGRPSTDARWANLFRAARAAGLNEQQAMSLTCEAYDAAHLYVWKIDGYALKSATRARDAQEHPRGKSAEEIAAELEGRPSRWGTLEFHKAAL
jgi:hypothetical protein